MGLVYTSIRVKDMKKSVQFYTKRMGLKIVGKRSPIPGEQVVSLADSATGQRINLMWYAKSNRLYTPWKENGVELDHLMFEVKDAKAAYNKLVRAGAPIAMKLFEGEKIVMGFVKDPNGIWIGLRNNK
jgi:catechol 2,3-dioxygenase-like lactoylglutathione lyase family enzyme